jgi:hypothetical protein
MNFDPNCMAIAIGSLPHKDVNKAIDIIQKYLPEAPIWPQLPQIGLNESMLVQYAEGMPCIKIDYENSKAYFDTSDENYIDEVSERLGLAMEGKYEEFGLSKEFAKGFYAMKERLSRGIPSTVKILKGHVTGPISFGLSMHDENGKSILYNDNMKDAVIRILAMKGKWQVSEFAKINKDIIPMVFFDEPYLTQIGTPFISIQKDEAIEILNTCLDTIEGIKGLHICGNTDWALVASTNTDVINFDAYAHPDTLSLYPEEVYSFLERGGMIAWGVTPSTEEIVSEDGESILNNFEDAVNVLCKTGFDKKFILKRSFISPSCGTGSLTEELAEKVFKVNYEVSSIIREKYL